MTYIISEENRQKIRDLSKLYYCSDDINSDEITSYIDKLNPVFWDPSENNSICLFCGDIGSYFNDQLELYACESCHCDIENREVDIFHPDDHPLSLFLFNKVRDWADRNEWTSIDATDYFNGYGITHNVCHLCGMLIFNISVTSIALTVGGDAVAHLVCAEKTGFPNHYTNYEELCHHARFDKCIKSWKYSPGYMLEISSADKIIIHNIIDSSRDTFDYSYPHYLLTYLHRKYWILTEKSKKCWFCRKSSQYYNKDLGRYSCKNCLNKIPQIDLMNYNCSVSLQVLHSLKEWMRNNMYSVMNANTLFNDHGLHHRRCCVCGRKINLSDNVCIAETLIAHESCKGTFLYLKTNPIMNKVLKSSQLNLQYYLSALQRD